MSDEKPIGLPPITIPAGKRTEGTLLSVPVKRLTKKSPALKAIERKFKPKKLATVTSIQKNAKSVR